ncbi:GAF domain-containing protein [Lichenicoccus roseus]|uniref:GAF domain-containing protein n=1 Tax=Lichenicoccus roseus TaxID=2683649 RepID=UPI001F0FDDCC|nr:GAF domain-containing protein [Lichenicoccus roseus]
MSPDLDDDLVDAIRSVVAGEPDFVANCANAAALLFERLPQVNWAGFYILRGEVLVLGPFQGRVACVRISLGQGVCGTAAARRETIVVPDVHQFPGHIACDAASRSEIVVPLLRGDRLLGVLDIDSPVTARFSDADRLLCEQVARLVVDASSD